MDFSNLTDMMNYVIFFVGFLFVIPALTMHEYAHAWMANRLGDPTARMMGRLSMNPLRHIDPIGTVAMPIGLLVISVLFTGIPFTFGWAKPVPFNPRYLKDPKRDTALVGLAGPAVNVLLAAISGFVLMLMRVIDSSLVFVFSQSQPGMVVALTPIAMMIGFFCYINLILCFFNLLPIPPFDGSRVVQKFLTGNARHVYGQLEQYGMFIILALIFVPRMMGFDLIGGYFALTAQPVFQLLTGIPSGALFASLFGAF